MARLTPVPPARRPPLTRLVGWLARRLFGREMPPYGIYAHAPAVAPAVMVMSGLFERGAWTLDPTLRKLVHLRVAQIVGCDT